jgi:hypothetical protein
MLAKLIPGHLKVASHDNLKFIRIKKGEIIQRVDQQFCQACMLNKDRLAIQTGIEE